MTATRKNLGLGFAVVASTIGAQGCAVCIHSPQWAYKTGMDSEARGISLVPVPTTIDSLLAIPHVKRPSNGRIAPAELTTYELRDVTITSFQRAADGDIHMVLNDEHGHTLIAEATPPSCTDATSPWRAQIAAVRATLDEVVGPSVLVWGRWTVSLAGVGFMDSAHGQPGVASNGMEIHPILAICFGEGCTLPGALVDTTRAAQSARDAPCARF
jgi:hypothetical protein